MKTEHEKIITRENGAKHKIKVHHGNSEYVVTTYVQSSTGQWFSISDKPDFFATPDEIEKAKLELWKQLKPGI